jgi:actin-like ATPase involved in cell morphogenesis
MEETIMAKIPTTDSIQELAVFWQNHDVTDFESELEEVSEPVFQRAHVVGVPLTEAEHQAIRDAAASRGLDEAALIHEWVKEKLGHR